MVDTRIREAEEATAARGQGAKMNSKNIARMAGFLYLVVALVGPFSLKYVPTTLIIPGDAATTAGNIMASEGLFRMGLVGEAVMFLVEVVLSVLLYVLLRSVSETLSLVAGLSRLSMAVVQGVNMLIGFAVLVLLSGAGYARTVARARVAVSRPAQCRGLRLGSLLCAPSARARLLVRQVGLRSSDPGGHGRRRIVRLPHRQFREFPLPRSPSDVSLGSHSTCGCPGNVADLVAANQGRKRPTAGKRRPVVSATPTLSQKCHRP
jgi:hypothetical protein